MRRCRQRIKVFEMACLRKIEGVTKRDKLRNSEIQRRLKWKHDVNHRIQQRRLKFFGHVVRMSNDRFPHMATNGYVHGMRSRGKPKKRWSLYEKTVMRWKLIYIPLLTWRMTKDNGGSPWMSCWRMSTRHRHGNKSSKSYRICQSKGRCIFIACHSHHR